MVRMAIFLLTLFTVGVVFLTYYSDRSRFRFLQQLGLSIVITLVILIGGIIGRALSYYGHQANWRGEAAGAISFTVLAVPGILLGRYSIRKQLSLGMTIFYAFLLSIFVTFGSPAIIFFVALVCGFQE